MGDEGGSMKTEIGVVNNRITKEPPLRVGSENLFKGSKEVVITHGKEEYRLHITKNDKLILTK